MKLNFKKSKSYLLAEIYLKGSPQLCSGAQGISLKTETDIETVMRLAG